MITEQKVDGRDAFVVYLTSDFRPAAEADAKLVKVIFKDTLETLYLTPPSSQEVKLAGFDPDEPRDESGQWTEGGGGGGKLAKLLKDPRVVYAQREKNTYVLRTAYGNIVQIDADKGEAKIHFPSEKQGGLGAEDFVKRLHHAGIKAEKTHPFIRKQGYDAIKLKAKHIWDAHEVMFPSYFKMFKIEDVPVSQFSERVFKRLHENCVVCDELMVLAGFNPGQERDEKGQWAAGGGVKEELKPLTVGADAPPKDRPLTLVYGGTFNPPHEGHVGALRDTIKRLEAAGYTVANAVVSPSPEKLAGKKLGDKAYPLGMRVDLTRSAFADVPQARVTGDPSVEADKFEGKLRRTQIADWARDKYPGTTVVAVTGIDEAPGHPPADASIYAGDKGSNHEGYYYVSTPRDTNTKLGVISSGKIREHLRSGTDVPKGWIKQEVVDKLKGYLGQNPNIKLGHEPDGCELCMMLAGFDPDQARDDHGRWTQGGGTGGGGKEGKLGVVTAQLRGMEVESTDVNNVAFPYKQYEHYSHLDDTNPNDPALAQIIQDPELRKQWAELRQEQMDMEKHPDTIQDESLYRLEHQADVQEKYEEKFGKDVEQGKQLYWFMGISASGKSYEAEKTAAATHSMLIDSDEYKKMLDGYDNGMGANGVHEESSMLANQSYDDALERGDNIVLPKIGDVTSKMITAIDRALDKGYTVNLSCINCDPTVAMLNNVRRFLGPSNRLVRLDMVNNIDTRPPAVYNQLYEHYRNNPMVKFTGILDKTNTIKNL